MSLDLIFAAQLAAVLAFIASLFVLYRLIVKQKDATIEVLKERITSLLEQVETVRATGPDILAKQLSERVKLLSDELYRLSCDSESNQIQICEKEEQLKKTRKEFAKLADELKRAQLIANENLCPHCASPLIRREFHPDVFEDENGREIDFEHDYREYVCGYSSMDGRPKGVCTYSKYQKAWQR